MKITKSQLKQIIREELEATLAENLEQAKKRVERYCPGPQCQKWKDALDRLQKTQRESIDRSLAEQAPSENDWNLLRITYQVCRRKKNPKENQSIARRMVAKHIAQAKRQNNWQGLVNHIKKKFCSDIEAVMAQQKKKHNLG